MSTFYHETVPNSPGIYKITCIPTKRIYVGSALNLRHRRKTHFNQLQHHEHHNPKLQAAWNKYGSDAFQFEIVELVLVPEMLTAREQYWLDTLLPFHSKGFNLNPTAGSSLGRVVPQSSREKSRATQLGRPSTRVGWHPTPEQIERQRQSLTGYKHTEQTRRKMGNARRGKTHSPQTKEKIRLANLGHEVSDETRVKISDANTRRVVSPETRARFSAERRTRKYAPEAYESRRACLIVTAPDGTEYTVHGVDAFAKAHGLDGSSLAKVARGKHSHHRGWTARYP